MKTAYNLETTPLEIMTDSVIGSNQEIHLDLYDAQTNNAGHLILRLRSSPHFNVWYCTKNTGFLTQLPAAVDKIWRLTKLPGPRVLVHCNGVKVVDHVISNKTCYYSSWSSYWVKSAVKIGFSKRWDSASDFYRPYEGNPSKFCTFVYVTSSLIR